MSNIIKRFYTIIGSVTLDHVKQMNKKGPEWVSAIDKVAKQEEKAVSSRVSLMTIIMPSNLISHLQNPKIAKIKIK